jgi:branched-chain amino acid transport system permease protein
VNLARSWASLRRPIAAGAVAGGVAIYLAMVGLFTAFADRPIVPGIGTESGPGLLTMGWVMMALGVLLAGLHVAGSLHQPSGPQSSIAWAIGGAGLSGLVGGAILGLFILLASAVDLRSIFVPVTPRLLDLLAFGQAPAIGAMLVTALGAAIGALAGGLQVLDPRDRGAVLTALGTVLLVALLEPILRPILGQLELGDVSGFLFTGGGLSLPAAGVILGAVGALSWTLARPAAPYRERLQSRPAEQRRNTGIGIAVAALLALLLLPQVSTGFVSLVLVNVGFFLMLALGLNIVVGYAGLLDLGYVAFYAVGAYTMAVLISPASSIDGPFTALVGPEWSFWLALPVVMIVAAIVGILIGAPVLRLRGDYLAIVTLGFGEIARILFGSDALRSWVGGPSGVVGLPNLHIPVVGLELTGPGDYFYPVVAFAAFAAFIAWRLSTSRTGRAWNAMREDESVAEATGVNTTNYKLLAFALGGSLGGLSGALFAVQLRSVFPGSFLLIVSITALAIIILGGMGTIRGVIVGALILVGLPEALREFGEYRFLVYGGALVAMMVLRPEGLFPSRIRRAELHEDIEPDEPEPGEGAESVRTISGPIVTHGPSAPT